MASNNLIIGLEIGAQTTRQLTRHLPVCNWNPVVLTVKEQYFPHTDALGPNGFPGCIRRTRVVPHPLGIFADLKARLHADTCTAPYSETTGRAMGTLRRWLLSLLRTPDIYTGWIPPAIVAGLDEIRRHSVTHLCSSAPYWSNHLIGLVLSRLTGLTWTAHFRDPWVGIPAWKPESALSRWIERSLERMVVHRSTSVVCVTERHAGLFRRRYPEIAPEKFVSIPNGFDETEWTDIGDRADHRTAARDTFVIRYAGSLHERRSPLPLFRAVRALVDAGEVDRSRLTIDLVGWCDVAEGRRVTEMADECGIVDRVTFTGPLGRTDTLRRMAQADLLLVLAEAQPYQIPGKTYEYLRAGRPILALTSDGALSDLLRETGGAWIVDPADQRGIAAAVREAYRGWTTGQRPPCPDSQVVATFDRRRLAARLAEVFHDGTP